jgi:hypothetical protein
MEKEELVFLWQQELCLAGHIFHRILFRENSKRRQGAYPTPLEFITTTHALSCVGLGRNKYFLNAHCMYAICCVIIFDNVVPYDCWIGSCFNLPM